MPAEVLPLGTDFPRGESIMEKGSKELLGVSHVVPLPMLCIRVNESRTGRSKCPERAGISNAVE